MRFLPLWFGFFLTSCFFFFVVVFLRIDPHPPGQSWPGPTQWAGFKPDGVGPFSF